MLRNKETGAALEVVSSMQGRNIMRGLTRDVMIFIIQSSYEEVEAFFHDGVQLEDVQTVTKVVISEATEENPNPIPERVTEEVVTDLCAYSLAGNIIDSRDGNFTVTMGAKTELELKNEELEADSVALRILLGEEV